MTDNADPRSVLFTILRSVQSKSKELPLQPVDVDGMEDARKRVCRIDGKTATESKQEREMLWK